MGGGGGGASSCRYRIWGSRVNSGFRFGSDRRPPGWGCGAGRGSHRWAGTPSAPPAPPWGSSHLGVRKPSGEQYQGKPSGSVEDPSPDPSVFGSSGFVSISQRYGSGYGSFYHQAKIVRKTLISTVLWLLYAFLSLKNDVNVPSKSNKQKFFLKLVFCWRLEGQWRK